MTSRVTREEIVDFETYRDERAAYRPKVIAIKAPRRVHVGGVLTFLFENHDTIRYQVQEMMLAERIVKEAEIRHELDTYNELLGDAGGLGCSLLIEIEDEKERAVKLTEWLALPNFMHIAKPNAPGENSAEAAVKRWAEYEVRMRQGAPVAAAQ